MNEIDAYISRQDERIQPRLKAVRAVLRAAMPDAAERLSWQMPTYWKGRNLIHFAACRNHIGIYPGGEAAAVFADRLKEYKTSKGAIQLPHDRELPLELIRDLALWCYGRYAK